MSVGRKEGNGHNKTAPSSGGRAGASPPAGRGIVESGRMVLGSRLGLGSGAAALGMLPHHRGCKCGDMGSGRHENSALYH